MIKIDGTVINKVQKSENNVITEIPIVQTNGGALLHLGYNTYKTTFDNPDLVTGGSSFWTLHHFKVGTPLTESGAAMPSTYIKAWLYSDTFRRFQGTKILTLRLNFSPFPWQYKAGRNYATDLYVELTYNVKLNTEDYELYVDRKWRMYTMHGSTATEVCSHEENDVRFSDAYGGLVSIIIPGGTFIPKCYNAFLTTSSSVSYADDTPFTGDLPITSRNANISVSVQIKEEGKNPSQIESYIEIGSYKPSDFSEYSPDYCLHTGGMENERKVGTSEVGQVTSTPYFTVSSSSSGDGDTGCVSATSKILVDLEGMTKNAEELHTGDKIVAYNKTSGTFIESTIETVYIQRKPIALYTLTFEDDTELSITAYHKILTNNGLVSILGDNDAEQLAAGSKVVGKDGEKTIKNVTSRTTEDGEIVYNFRTVEGGMFIADGIIIENESKNTIAVKNLGDNTQEKV